MGFMYIHIYDIYTFAARSYMYLCLIMIIIRNTSFHYLSEMLKHVCRYVSLYGFSVLFYMDARC